MRAHRHFLASTRRRIPIRAFYLPVILAAGCVVAFSPLEAQSLRGSTASLDRQERAAEAHDFTYITSPAQLEKFVKAGYLVQVRPNRDFDLHGVSYPFARPETRTFILRLANQYRQACGEKLVVTSLTRPLSRQPQNASSRSVHPTGMAMDLRRSNNRACRSWLENVLVSLEGTGVLEATRESYPPHYHVAVFPEPYSRYVDQLTTRNAEPQLTASGLLEYRVRNGDSLWDIAQAHGTTVDRLKQENNLRGSRILAGQLLRVPVAR